MGALAQISFIDSQLGFCKGSDVCFAYQFSYKSISLHPLLRLSPTDAQGGNMSSDPAHFITMQTQSAGVQSTKDIAESQSERIGM